MDDRIYFTKDISGLLTSQFGGDLGEDTIVVYHAMYDKPDVRAKEILEWEKYRIVYGNYEPRKLVLIGLNRMKTPSNRCDFIHAHLSVMNPDIHKIVIDTAPFIGEPWRLYFHYQTVNRFGGFGANYSYPIEGEWRRWFERDVDECIFSSDKLKGLIVDTWTDLPRLETSYELFEPDAEMSKWYEEVRGIEFESFRSAKLLLASLLRKTNKHLGLDLGYDSYLTGQSYRVPNLGIYRFMVEENLRRQAIYNHFAL